MIGVSKLLCNMVNEHDVLRYGRDSSRLPSHLLQFSRDKKPIVVWNMTEACNLKCVHCYANAGCKPADNEIASEQAVKMIDDMAAFGVPTLLFSGGEPLMRKDLFDLGAYAKSRGMRTVISTNGTLIEEKIAEKIKESGFSYVGISLDGLSEVNDRFRGVAGSFEKAVRGIKNCQAAGVKVGLRFTITAENYKEVPAVFDFIKNNAIPRVCFYHIVYSGRGSSMLNSVLPLDATRKTVDFIFDKTVELYSAGNKIEVLTVDNHCDGVNLYLRLLKSDPERAASVYKLLEYNGGNNSGIAIACVDQAGEVHADQFWRHYSFGNVTKRKFSEIWSDTSNELMFRLKDRKKYLTGRCGKCKFLNICNGNFRVRAEAVHSDIWAPDPACYLTDEEIGI